MSRLYWGSKVEKSVRTSKKEGFWAFFCENILNSARKKCKYYLCGNMGPSNDIFIKIYGSQNETKDKQPYQCVITFIYTDEKANLWSETF